MRLGISSFSKHLTPLSCHTIGGIELWCLAQQVQEMGSLLANRHRIMDLSNYWHL